MNIFIYLFEPTGHGLDEIEDSIEEALDGRGNVTGTGTGNSGANIDIEVTDESITPERALAIVRRSLRNFNLPPSTQIAIDGTRHGLMEV
jgi:hypothetical protein